MGSTCGASFFAYISVSKVTPGIETWRIGELQWPGWMGDCQGHGIKRRVWNWATSAVGVQLKIEGIVWFLSVTFSSSVWPFYLLTMAEH